jgi:Flp pilus assembly protein TadG
LRTSHRRRSERGQSIVEFALILPVLVFLMVGIVDLARIYTTMLSIESAAREAADYGSFYSTKWADPAVAGTRDKMKERACVAASDLTDYAGPDANCSNPTVTCALSPDQGTNWVTCDDDPAVHAMACNDEIRTPPCWVRATVTYRFNLLVPLNFEVFGVRYGIPNSITFSRSSIFSMTDLSL